LIPVLEAILEQFPFRIRGFHSDNGSEYINFNVARLLSKLLIGQTTSRSLHSNDNGLVDANHGAVIRKHLGYGFIDAPYSGQITGFHSERLNPYVKFHRSCAAHALRPVGKGKLKCVCRGWAAPYELLREVTKRPWPCKRPSGNCSGVSDARSHERAAAHGRELGLWKCRALEAEEKGSAVSPRSHRPWKSLRDSHIPTASTTTIHVHTQHKTRGRGKSSAAPDTLRTHLRKVAP
jgi:transposase InsO family protein